MALGPDGLITVVGDVDTITDTKASGTLTVTLSDKLVVGDKTYFPIDQIVNLNPNDGTFSIKLPPTGDSGVTYRFSLVAYAFVNGQREHFEETTDTVLTADQADDLGVIQYNSLLKVAAPGVPQTFITRNFADARYLLKDELPELPDDVVDEATLAAALAPLATQSDLSTVASTASAAVTSASGASIIAQAARTATDAVNAKLATDYSTTSQTAALIPPAAATAALATIAPLQGAISEARKGVVDGSFGVSIGIHDAAPASLYSSQNPAAEYDPLTNRTYIAYLSSEQRALAIRYFDHATGTFSTKRYIADYLITNTEDTHGAPSLAIDQNARRIIISYGVHNTNLALARSGPDLDIMSWTVIRPAFSSSYGHVAYNAADKATYVMFRAGTLHTADGGPVPNAHECARIVKSTDGGATWSEVVGARINTKILYPNDLGTDFYGSDFDAYNGRVYISFSIAHAVNGAPDPHDGPRAGAYVCYLDPADGLLHSVDGQVIDLYTTVADFAKARITTGDFTYPIKTAVAPNGNILTAYNKYDSTLNYVRNYAALWDGLKWTVTDTGVYANYLYNGTAIQYRVINGVGTWELLAVRNLSGDNVVASTDQKDTLNGSSNGGDVVKLKSTDGLNFTVDAVWDSERFTTPITYVQSVRYAEPGLLFLLQGVLYSTMADQATGVSATRGSGNIASYNASDQQSEIFFMYASTNLPAVLNIQRRPEVQYNVNPINRLVGSQNTPRVTPPTTYTTLNVSPDPLPRGTRSVRLRVTCQVSTAAVGRVLLQFRQGTSYRDSDDEVTFDGNVTWEQIATVDVPVGADGNIQWRATTDSGITAPVGLTIRSFTLGAQRMVPKTPKSVTAKAPTATVTIPTNAPDTTPPTAPTSVAASGGNGQATLTPNGATDNLAVTGYRAYTAASGGTVAASGASPLTVTGLTNGTAYTFYVSAVDAAGNESGRTASSSVTPTAPAADTTAPTAPTSVAASAGNGQAVLTPSGATDAVGVTGYKAYAAQTGGTAVATGTGATVTVTGLTNGTAYTFWVSALDAAGNESIRTQSASVTPVVPAAGVARDFSSMPAGYTQTSSYATTPGQGSWSAVNGELALAGSAAAAVSNYLWLDPFTSTYNNVKASASPSAVSTTSTPIHPQVVINESDAANYAYGGYNVSAGGWQIHTVIGGTDTASTVVTAAVPTLPYTPELSRSGDVYTLKVAGATVTTMPAPANGLTGVGVGVRYRAGGANASQSEVMRVTDFAAAPAA